MPALVASTVTGLGSPSEDGAKGLIRTTHVEMPLSWDLAQQVWIGEPFVTMRINENVGLTTSGTVLDWRYPGTAVETPVPVVHPTQYRFFIHKVLYAGELWAAGLRMQEHLSGEMAQYGGVAGVYDAAVALAWYPLAEGDDFLSPEPYNIGVQLIRDKDDDPQRYRWCSTGWQNNVTIGVGNTVGDTTEPNVAPTITQHLYPEIYMYGAQCNLRHFTALHRWVGGTGVGSGGASEVPSKFPPFTGSGDSNRNVRAWYRADSIGSPINAGVEHWPDYSGYGRPMRQPDATKRPTLMTSDLGNHKFVRFDGTNDFLGNHLSDRPIGGPEEGQPSAVIIVPPYSISLVMRQRATGNAQQVWIAHQSSGAPIIYRGDNAGQVNTWVGAEPTFDIGSWPTGWFIYSLRINADNTFSIRVNGSEVSSGSGATAGFTGMILANNQGQTLPGAIDVAEVICTYGDMTQAEQITLINYLNDYYAIF